MLLRIILFLTTLGILLQALVLQQPLFGAILLFLYLFSGGILLAKRCSLGNTLYEQIMLGSFSLLAFFSVSGSALYYANISTKPFFLLLLFLTGIGLSLYGSAPKWTPKSLPYIKSFFIPLLLFFTSLSLWWEQLASFQITESIRSPWLVIPLATVLFLSLATFSLLLFFKKLPSFTKTSFFPLLFSLLLFSLIGLAMTVYPIGYGFDAFIHRATVLHIAEFGTIQPKPFYYIGQYALELFTIHGFYLPLKMVDTLLIPLLSAFFLPAMVYSLQKEYKLHPFSLFALLFIPLSSFIVTTPQTLGYLYTIGVIFLSLRKSPSPALLILFSLASAITHPIAGIPTLLYTTMWFIFRYTKRWNKPLAVLFGLTSLIALPTVFALNAYQQGLEMHFSVTSLLHPVFPSFSFFENHYLSFTDLLYFLTENTPILLGGTLIYTIFLILKKEKTSPLLLLPLFGVILTLTNYYLLAFGFSYDFLASSEQQNYANRLLEMSAFFLLPALIVTFHQFAKHFFKRPQLIGLLPLFLLISFYTGAKTYATYPRHNAYETSHGFPVSQSDINAVKTIKEKADGQPYIVLSHQMTSAAALSVDGFAAYYGEENFFYYPIPTGGPLYELFLEMNTAPQQEIINNVQEMTGVDTVFFAVSDYWWNANFIREETKKIANDWFTVGDITIFIFQSPLQ